MDIAARIRATGIETGSTDSKDRQICSVKCQGCGNIIRTVSRKLLNFLNIYRREIRNHVS